MLPAGTDKLSNQPFNLLSPRSDQHQTSPYNILTFIQQIGSENIQTYQVDVVILI